MNLDTRRTYLGRITSVAVGESKEKKTPQIVFTIAVEGAEDGDDVTPTTAYVYRYLTDKTVERVFEDLMKLGYPHNELSRVDSQHPQRHDFTDMAVRLKVKYETYNNRDQERWDFAFGGGEVKRADASVVSALDARFSKMFAAKRAATPQQSAPAKPMPKPTASAPGGGEGKDIPF